MGKDDVLSICPEEIVQKWTRT